jgi:LacI family transcriptional regulator
MLSFHSMRHGLCQPESALSPTPNDVLLITASQGEIGLRHRVGTRRIALRAGVSTATVDRVLNDRHGVRPETSQKVLEAVSALSHEISADIDRGRSPRSHVFSIVIQSAAEFNERIRATIEELDDAAFLPERIELRPSITSEPASEPFARRIEAAARDSDGMIIACQEATPIRDAVNALVGRNFPVICIATDLPTTNRLGYVSMDQYRAGRAAGTLIGRFIGEQSGEVLLIVSANFRCQQEREIGFREVMRESFHNLTVSERLQSADGSDRGAYENIRAYLDSGRRPIGVYNVSGGNGGIIRALSEIKYFKWPVYVGHDLTPAARSFLLDRRIDAVIDDDGREALRRAIRHLINFRTRDNYSVGFDPLPIRICLADTV